MSAHKQHDNLVWIDLEFTQLDPTQGFIMQAAMIVTTAQLQPLPTAEGDTRGLLFDVQLTPAQAETASEWVQQHQQKQLQRSLSPSATPLADVAAAFEAYVASTCERSAKDIRLRPLLAGNSVHGDQRYLQQHMPQLLEGLSFRLLDVTSIKELARRWCPKLEFQKSEQAIRDHYPGDAQLTGTTHDALYDIKASIAELHFYRQKIFAEVARAQA